MEFNGIELAVAMRIYAAGMRAGNKLGQQLPVFDAIADDIDTWADMAEKLKIENTKIREFFADA